MHQYNVMITGTSSYGVGEGMIKVVNNSRYREMINLFGASNSQLTAYKNIIDEYFILPSAREPGYLESLKKTILSRQIDILIPGSVKEAEIISKSYNEFIDLNIDIWVNKYSLIELFNYKQKAYDFFVMNGLNTPKIFTNNGEIDKDDFPLILKPVTGKGSEGIYIVYNFQQLISVQNLYKSFNIDYIVQDYIEGQEYTVSLINLGSYQKIFTMQRILNKGASQFSVYEKNDKIEGVAQRLHQLLKDELVLNIQLIRRNDDYYIIEINPRFSGSAPLRALLGFNEFDVIFAEKYLNKSIAEEIKKELYAIRGYCEFTYPQVKEGKL